MISVVDLVSEFICESVWQELRANMASGYFKTRGYIPGGIIKNTKNQALDVESLPPFMRALLVTDGTVTKILEAYFWEHISVQLRFQKLLVADWDIPFIDVTAGQQILEREVILKGDESSDIYCYASSYIRLESLQQELRDQLVAGKMGIGELLREVGLETYREIMDFSRKNYVNGDNSSSEKLIDTVERIYVISIDGRPAIQVTERFPLALFDRKLNS